MLDKQNNTRRMHVVSSQHGQTLLTHTTVSPYNIIIYYAVYEGFLFLVVFCDSEGNSEINKVNHAVNEEEGVALYSVERQTAQRKI